MDYYTRLGNIYADRKAMQERNKQPRDKNTINARELTICVYDEGNIDLFVTKQWTSKISRDEWTGFNSYDAGIIYQSLDNKLIGLKRTHYSVFSDDTYLPINSACSLLDGSKYVSNCQIEEEISFNEIRKEMFANGLINSFDIREVSRNDILEVLNYFKINFKTCESVKKRKK